MKNSYITVTDQFCGAGGSSQGVRNAAQKFGGGLEVKLALNHWKLAIETHSTNFPDTDHDCTDISACDPRRYKPTNILITSPECTNHSLANGKKKLKKQMDMFASGKLDASAERSRATMWDVPRFAEYHDYEAIIVENVVDARTWIMFDSWLHAMHSLGYMHRCVYVNSMFFWPTPQSRDRMYVVFWKKGNKAPMLDYMPLARCGKCEKDINAVQSWKNPNKKYGKYKFQYVYCCPVCSTVVSPYYYASFNCIDFSDRGTRIGDRKKPLSPNSIRRIKYGREKYGNEYFIINDQHSTGIDYRVRSANENLGTITTTPHFKIVAPFIIKEEHAAQLNVKSSTDPLQTQVTRQSLGVTFPVIVDGNYNAKPSRVDSACGELPTISTQHRTGLLSVPHIVELNSTGKSKPSYEPTATFTSGGINHGIVNVPFIIENKGQSNARSSMEHLGCITTKDYQGLITTEAFNAFISSFYNGSDCLKHVTDAMGSITTKDRHSLVSYSLPDIDDYYYRMLKPHEVQLGMAFDKDYTVLGNAKEKVKQLGNAVTPPPMEWLITQVVESLS